MLKKIVYTFGANFIALIASVFVTFVVPKSLSVEAYGYFQLYLFYVTYSVFLNFGWADGIFLKYGGEYYDNLRKSELSGQILLYNIFELIISLIIVFGAFAYQGDYNKRIIIICTGVSVILVLPRILLQYILQSTNRIKEYATLTIVEKIGYVICVAAAIAFGTDQYIFFIVADQIGKMCSLVCSAYHCRDLLKAKPDSIDIAFEEAMKNISIGIKLVFANIAGMFIIGIIRLSVEAQWDVVTFGKISLTISISNLLMVFIRAVSLVMFPALRRTATSKISEIYVLMRTGLMIPLLGMLIFYYPAKVILSAWLPQYADSLVYMALLFPMCVFESKMSMLIETYMKTLRKEKWLLLVNVTTVSLSVVITLITTYWLHNLDLAVASIVFLLAFRCVFAELLLSTVLDVNVKTDIVLELALTIVFVGASWFVGGIAGLAIYAVAYLVYLFIKRNDVAFVLNTALRMVRRA